MPRAALGVHVQLFFKKFLKTWKQPKVASSRLLQHSYARTEHAFRSLAEMFASCGEIDDAVTRICG
eukprot:752032-Hanusia_phi.AAC.4